MIAPTSFNAKSTPCLGSKPAPVADVSPESAVDEQAPETSSPAPLTADELHVLLSTTAPLEKRPITQATADAFADEAEAKLLEAEGVLAEELAQLMADKETQEPTPANIPAPSIAQPPLEPTSTILPLPDNRAIGSAPVSVPAGVPEYPVVELLDPSHADTETMAAPEKPASRSSSPTWPSSRRRSPTCRFNGSMCWTKISWVSRH